MKPSNINSSHEICIFSLVCFTLLGDLKCHLKKCILCSSNIFFRSEPNASNMFYFILLFSLGIYADNVAW